MAFTKIQPQQLQLPTFTSPSGDFSFTDLSTGVQINLERDIDGPIDFNGGATIDSDPIITTENTNSIAETCFVFGGSDNEVTGIFNVLINGFNNTDASGEYNTLLNGTLVDFGASGKSNTVLAGRAATFADQTTGAVILADHEGSATNSTNHSLLVSFNSGVNFEAGDVNFNSHLKVDSSHSGIFSGNCQFNTGNFTNGMSVGVNNVFAVSSDGDVTTDGNITAADGDVTASVGDIIVTLGNIRTAQGNIVAQQGGIIADVGNITATAGNVTAPDILASEDLGYSSGSAETQSTSTGEPVTLNAPSGVITGFTNGVYNAGTTTYFTLNNTTIGINDVVVVSLQDGNVNLSAAVTTTAAGSCIISITNHHTTTHVTATLKVNFAVIKVATS